ncbi:MAG: phosphatase PAP2 family protein [Acidobacteria bacterium]|nr:phosphatase PAP2 family protein [Acidobacteriota bacterium]
MRTATKSAETVLLCCAVAATTATLGLAVFRPEVWDPLSKEDTGPEAVTVVALLLLASVAAVRARSAPLGARLPLVLIVALGLFAAGEEISWGQRFLAFEAPGFFANHNVQAETNLHNLIHPPFDFLLGLVVLIAFGLAPAVEARPVARALVRRGVPWPRWRHVGVLFGCALPTGAFAASGIDGLEEVVELVAVLVATAVVSGMNRGSTGKGEAPAAKAFGIACLLSVFLSTTVSVSRLQAAEFEPALEPEVVAATQTSSRDTELNRVPDLFEPPGPPNGPPLAGGSLRPLASRFAIDLKALARLPIDAKGKAWRKFGLGLALVGALHSFDEDLRTRLDSSGRSDVATLIRPLGQEGGLALLGSSWAIGRLAGRPKAFRIGRDGFEAVALSAGVLAPLLKDLVGRERPRRGMGSEVFGGSGQSFPSGEVTQAFAIASVVSAHSRRKWVKGLAWTLAGATAWQRMELDAHWASDVTAGALLGASVGRWVVHRNGSLWSIQPQLVNGAGVSLRRTF